MANVKMLEVVIKACMTMFVWVLLVAYSNRIIQITN